MNLNLTDEVYRSQIGSDVTGESVKVLKIKLFSYYVYTGCIKKTEQI